jgi:sulfatase maturation enzyme AslB (radical SAM superfamily)
LISCYAAFNHINITRTGALHPCCFSGDKEYWTKEFRLKDYWFGKLNESYQENFLNQSLHKGCRTCKDRIENKLLPPIIDYDHNVGDERLQHALSNTWPKIIDFEISNLCNMECPMCMGHLSSKHAANRDKNIKFGPNVFDNDENLDHLIEELKEFIPYLEEIRFVGGEPLAHKGMFKIAKVIYDIKPKLKLSICTNGSVYNKKVERLCKENNVKFTISLDTVIPEEYHQIRIGGKFDSTYSNVNKIEKLVGRNKIEINTVLMSVNTENIIEFFKYSLNNDYKIFVNTYSLHGRTNSPDWGLHLVPFDIKWKVIKQCKEFLKKDLSDNYIAQLNKVIKLLS